MKKIAFVGAHGVGKSTASYYLTSLLKQKNPGKSVICLEENVRNIAQLVNGNLKHKDFYKLAIANQLFRELKAEQQYDIIVTDRSLMDFIVYANVKEKVDNTYLELSYNHLRTFDKIYFIRPDDENSKIANDGFRDTNKKFRNQIDEEFVLFLSNYCYYSIKTSQILTHDYLKDLN